MTERWALGEPSQTFGCCTFCFLCSFFVLEATHLLFYSSTLLRLDALNTLKNQPSY